MPMRNSSPWGGIDFLDAMIAQAGEKPEPVMLAANQPSAEMMRSVMETRQSRPTNTPPRMTPREVAQSAPQGGGQMDMAAKFRELMEERQGGIKGMQTQIQNLEANPTERGFADMDLSPLMNWAAGMSGNPMIAQGYKGPQKKPTDQEIKDKLQAAIAKEQGGLSNDYLKLMAYQQRNDDRAADEEYRRQMLGLERSKLAQKGSGLNLTPGQEAVDKAFAKDYATMFAGGGAADMRKNLTQLKGTIGKLEAVKPSTGTGILPGMARDVLDPRSSDIQQQVEEIVQRNLKAVLGGQFSEKEGKQLIERAYNPRQPWHVNKQRLDRLATSLEQAAQAKIAAAEYFEGAGTLAGYRGSQIDAADIYNMDLEGAPTNSGTPQYANEYEEYLALKKKRGM